MNCGALVVGLCALRRRCALTALGVGSRRRWVLAALEVVVLWNVAFWYGHPEYPLALSFMLFAVVDATDGRWARCGWLFGVAIALQPIVLAVVGVAFAFAPARRWLGLVLGSWWPPWWSSSGP